MHYCDPGDTGSVTAVALAPNLQLLAVAAVDGAVCFARLVDGRLSPLALLPSTCVETGVAAPTLMAWSHNSARLLVASPDGAVREVNAPDGCALDADPDGSLAIALQARSMSVTAQPVSGEPCMADLVFLNLHRNFAATRRSFHD